MKKPYQKIHFKLFVLVLCCSLSISLQAQNLEQLFGSEKKAEKDLWEKSRMDYYLSESETSLMSPETYFYQGNTKLRNGLYAEAIADYQNSITHDNFPVSTLGGVDDGPSNEQAYLNISLCFQLLYQNDSAMHYCELAIQENKYYLDAYLRTAEILAGINRFNDAATFLSDAMGVFPESKKLYFNLALIYSRQGKASKTKRYLKKAIDIDPDYDDANIYLASIYILEYNIDGAMRILTKSIDAGKKPILPLFYRAIIYAETGEQKKAYNDLQRAYLLDTVDNPVTSRLVLLDFYYKNFTRANKLTADLRKAALDKDSTYFKRSDFVHLEVNDLMDFNRDSLTANKANIDVLNTFFNKALHKHPDEAFELVKSFREENPLSIYAERLYGFAYFVIESDNSFFDIEFSRTRNFTEDILNFSIDEDHSALYNAANRVLMYDSTIISQYILKGMFQFSSGDFKELINTTTLAIAIDSFYYAPYQLRVAGNVSLKNYPATVADLERLIELSNDFVSYAPMLAYSYYQSGDYEKALETNTELLEYLPDDIITKYNQGLCFEMTGQLDSAMIYFKSVSQSIPSKSEYTRAISNVYQAKGDYISALMVLKEAASREYSDNMLLVDIADLYLEQGNYEDALTYYKKSYKAVKNYTYGYLGAAECYSLMENYDKAIPLYEKAIELMPKHAYSHYALGMCYARQKNYSESNKAAYEATQLDPEYAEALQLMSENFFYLGRYSVSVSMGLKVLEIDPGSKASIYQVAASTLGRGNYEEAIDFYQRIVETEGEVKSDAYDKAIEMLEFLILFDIQADHAKIILSSVFNVD